MIHHQPPTIQQARKLVSHYEVQPHKCEQHKTFTTCTGTQSKCVYHGSKCVPDAPVRYRFNLWWKGDKIMVSLVWSTEV